jgi:tetratricopeptide (TPR) repeat protein
VKTLFGTKLGLKPLSKWDVREIEDGWATVAEQVKETLQSPPSKMPQQLLMSATPPAPPRSRWKPAALAAVLVAVTVGGATLWLRDQSTTARADLRVDRADLALERLARLPAWLDVWPGLGRVRTVAELNVAGLEPKADTPTLARRLRELVAAHPDDADLRYLQARERFRQADEEGLAQAVEDATAALRLDPAHAAAHNLLGLAADLRGDLRAAQPHYQQAHTLAPDEPSYRSHLARNQLDLGNPAQALQTYQGVENRYILAPFGEALAYWALGKLTEAEQAQSRALALLDDREAMARAANRRSWMSVQLDPHDPDRMVSVTIQAEHRRCLIATERQITRTLRAGHHPDTWHPPADCQGLEQLDTLMDVVDADLCRYVIHRQPVLRDMANALRKHLLRRSVECPPLLG